MRIILARHGQSFVNVDPAKYAGQDTPLTPLGEAQAHALGVWLKTHHITDIGLIYASPLKRANQTAEIVNCYLEKPLEIDADLVEIERFDWGLLEKRDHPQSATISRTVDPYYAAFHERVGRFFTKLVGDVSRTDTLLVVAHGGTNGTLIRHIFRSLELATNTNNTGLHIFDWHEGNWIIRGINVTRHLPMEMLS
ncbi:MAG TPA: histidine phosphatase family protein [Aggregatilineales bacterium]|nr:histidine phosphatase family protein [Anaerolineales bacterium]HRE49437.1 histidine phosphatase family protein [Aggregatilineales bacterium]